MMKKRQQEDRFNPEQHIKDAIERKFGCPANMEEASFEASRHCYTFSLDGDRTRLAYAWIAEGGHPLFPKVEITTERPEAAI